jgi:hypothetical protein
VRTDCPNVLGNVPRASQCVPPLPDPNHRDWRLRRDTVDVAMEIDVEHGVADYRHAPLGGGVEQGRDAISRDELLHGRGT